jgi:hypothetical protein
MKYIFTFLLLLPLWLWAQLPTQIIKGKVTDISSKQPLVGATVFLADSTLSIGAQTDENGDFRLENVPTGRQTIICKYLGYSDFYSRNAIITSGKEVEMNIAMEEKISTEKGVEILATKAKDKAVNDFSVVSTRSFNIEQVQRFPATVNDPGRMAMAFPGVQASRDNNNDIIVRGNSPAGLLWRLEGIDIANPNHFARKGSSGGGITVFSLSLMAESDFSMAAFAPEYGNAYSGVFDMKFRKGNMDKREFTGRIGLVGLDFATEGPIQKGKSSYLANYRYSTLGILNKMGFNLVGKRTDNNFQDLSFNLNFKTSQNGTLTVFGIGGISRELWNLEKDSLFFKDANGNADVSKLNLGRDYRTETNFVTHTGALGATYTHLLDEKSFLKIVAVATASKVTNTDDTLRYDANPSDNSAYFRTKNEAYLNGRYATSFAYNRKFNARLNFKTGFQFSNLFYNVHFDRWNFITKQNELVNQGQGSTILVQPYAQIRYRISEKLTFTGGLHAMFLTLNKTKSLEPRAAFAYNLNAKQQFSIAYGLHSAVQPLGNYFTQVPNLNLPNLNLNFTKAHHFVMAYNHVFGENFRLKTELYYQYMYNLPVASDPNRLYSPINDRDGYAPEPLVNKGKGKNYGIDITIDKYFANKFFFLTGLSLYRSTYSPLNGKVYSTRYDGKFNSSLMAGKEFFMKKGGVIECGFRAVYSGGLLYTPGDLTKSRAAGMFVPVDSLVNSKKLPNFFRTDVRVAYRKSKKKYSYVVALDIQNVTNRKNYATEIYNSNKGQLELKQQATLTPVISFMVDF